MIDAYDDIIVSYIIIGIIATLFGFLLCFSPPFKQHDKEKDNENKEDEESDEKKPLLENEIEAIVSGNDEQNGVHPESRDEPKENTENPLDKKTMKPWLFWTITIIVTLFIFMYTGIEGSYGGLLATYATEVGAASTAGASYMTSCTSIILSSF